MHNIQAIITDQQYEKELINQNGEIRPYQVFPKPSEGEYETYLNTVDLSLRAILDSPISVYEFKKFCSKSDQSLPSIIDFVIAFERVQVLDTPDLSSALALMEIALDLPAEYHAKKLKIKEMFNEAFGPLETDMAARDSDFIEARVDSIHTDDPDVRANNNIDSKGNEAFPDPKPVLSSFASERNRFPTQTNSTLRRRNRGTSFLSPFGRTSISFGGFMKKKSHHQGPEGFESTMETEILTEEALKNLPKIMSDKKRAERKNRQKKEGEKTPVPSNETEGIEFEGDFYDRQHARLMKENKEKVALKQQCLKIFSDLAFDLRSKTEQLLNEFTTDDEHFVEMINLLWYSEQKLAVNDFVLFRDLGRGAFGVVSAAKTKTTGTLTAIKCMNKKLIKGKKAKRLVTVEKAILEVLGDNPSNFTIWLKYSFQDKDYFFMAIPLCTGGDMAYHLKKRRCFDEDRARFHFAEILEGIAHLHSLEIVYRDMKPDNVIFDAQGHARISDMGLAIQTKGKKIRGRAGTPGYWAPEVITRQAYSYSADYWSLGCLLYEMLTGLCPFSTTNSRMERDKATLHWKIKFPRKIGRSDKPDTVKPFPPDAMTIILGLLNRNRTKRFDVNDLRQEKWFELLDWFALETKQLPVPWVPKAGTIYAQDQLDLEIASNENNFKREKLGPEDEIANFNYTSVYSHQLDIVRVLETRDTGNLLYHNGGSQSWCCFM